MDDTIKERTDDWPIEKVKKFLLNGCGCAFGPKGSLYSRQFSEEVVLYNLYNCLELTNDELDLVILANVQACTNKETMAANLDAVFSISNNLFAKTCFYIFMV